MLELTIKLPESTFVTPLYALTSLTFVHSESGNQVPEDELRLENDGAKIAWQTGCLRVTMAASDLLDIEVRHGHFSGANRLFVVIGFQGLDGPHHKKMIIGPESNVAWFNQTADQLRCLIWPRQSSQN